MFTLLSHPDGKKKKIPQPNTNDKPSSATVKITSMATRVKCFFQQQQKKNLMESLKKLYTISQQKLKRLLKQEKNMGLDLIFSIGNRLDHWIVMICYCFDVM